MKNNDERILKGIKLTVWKRSLYKTINQMGARPRINFKKPSWKMSCILNLRVGTAKIEELDILNIHKKKLQVKNYKPFFKINPCYGCGKLHLFKNCLFKHKNYHICGRKGHQFSHCRLGGGNYSKNKRRGKYTIEQTTTKKYTENT